MKIIFLNDNHTNKISSNNIPTHVFDKSFDFLEMFLKVVWYNFLLKKKKMWVIVKSYG